MNRLILQLSDSAFPTGGFAHSAGLEAAIQLGEVRDRDALLRFVIDATWQTGYGALPFVLAGHRESASRFGDGDVDRLCDAYLTSAVANRASRTQGRALVSTCARVFDASAIALLYESVRANAICGHYAPLFGACCSALGIEVGDAQSLFLHQTVRGITSAAVRLGLIGPHEAQRVQHRSHDVQVQVLAECSDLTTDDVAQTAPLLELFASKQDTLYSRLFQS